MKMIEDGKSKKFDLILAKEVSRFSRDTIDSLLYTRKLLEYDICVYFLSDNIITASNDGELRLTIMSSMAQDEVRKLSERTKFGFQRALEKGTVLGTNNIWGYRKENGKLIIDKDEALIVKTIFEVYANTKMGLSKLSKYLESQGYLNHKSKPFHQNTLKKIIQNYKYKGFYTGNISTVIDYRSKKRNFYSPSEWKLYKDYEKVPPIVSEELWEKANKKLLERSNNSNLKCGNTYALSGKIHCEKHNCNFVRKIKHYKNKPDLICWECKNYHDTGNKNCSTPLIIEQDIYNILISKFKDFEKYNPKILQDLLAFYKDAMDFQNSKQILENELNILLNKKDKLLDLALDGILSNDDLMKKEFDIKEQIKSINSKLKELELINSDDIIKNLENEILNELNINMPNLDNYIDTFLDKIIICKDGRFNIICK